MFLRNFLRIASKTYLNTLFACFDNFSQTTDLDLYDCIVFNLSKDEATNAIWLLLVLGKYQRGQMPS